MTHVIAFVQIAIVIGTAKTEKNWSKAFKDFESVLVRTNFWPNDSRNPSSKNVYFYFIAKLNFL